MAALADLERALVNADRAGDTDAARKLAAAIMRERSAVAADPVAQIPGQGTQPPAEEAPGIGQQVLDAIKQTLGTTAGLILAPVATARQNPDVRAAGEAGLAIVSGLTTGAAGMAAGAAGGLAGAVASGEYGTPQGAQRVQQAAEEGAQALTFQPRTEGGQELTAKVGKALEALVPVMPLTAELSAAGRAASAARPAVQATVQAVGAEAKQAARAGVEAVQALRERTAQATQQSTPTPGTMGSVGAAGTDIATIRRQTAQDMPVPIDLTKGQATRQFEQMRFEGEMAKDPNKGEAIRQRFADQNAKIYRNLDVWVDQTGAELTDLRSVGDAVQAALAKRAAANKNEIRAAYKRADKSAEGDAPVNPGQRVSIGEGETALTASPIDFLNSKPAGLATTALSDHARQYAVKLGIAELRDGELVGLPTTVRQMEAWRKEINAATGYDPVQVRDAAILKQLIDAQTEPIAGPLYRQARGLRARYAQNYEDIGLIYDLMNNKRGLADAKVAAEDVFRRSMLNSSFEEMRQLRRILQTGGEDGKQAWRELQGAAVRYIRDEATKNVARNERGDPIVSAAAMDKAIKNLDKGEKLAYIFGKKGAEQLRALNELTQYVKTVPPGSVNTSNTASVLLAALDMATSGVAGMPLPVMSGLRILTTHVKERQIQKRIREALGIEEPRKVKKPESVIPARPTSTRIPENRTVQ